jgi:predicted ATPase
LRLTQLKIDRWRNLSDLSIELDPSSDFVCLVGENGSGKSNLLELIAFASPFLGLGEATVKRPFPLEQQEPFMVSVTLDVSDDVSRDDVVAGGAAREHAGEWDGTIVFAARGVAGDLQQPAPQMEFPYTGGSSSPPYHMHQGTYAGGVTPDAANEVGSRVVESLQRRKEVLHLFIDADRVFPEISISDAEVLERTRQIEATPPVIRHQATLATQNLYLEWMRALLAEQQRQHREFIEAVRLAQIAHEASPVLEDPLERYREALDAVLPHLSFVRLHPGEHRLIYNSAGRELPYEHLSGGERELAFLVGQMERFGIKNGLFLLDEPELHLNAELLQRWLGYLRSSTEQGQVWIATHSLEAVEVAGLTATLVLERDSDRTVRSIRSIDKRPVLATLAPLLGTPAFSVASSTFVLVEGMRAGRERERFVQVTGSEPAVHFLEAGGCREVAARFAGLALLASESEQLRVGAVVDRDHRSDAQAREFQDEHGVWMLPVHEIENFYLQPELLDALLDQRGDETRGHDLLVNVFDPLAGIWIWGRTVQQQEWSDVPNECAVAARGLSWSDIESDRGAAAAAMLHPLEGTNPQGSTASQRRAAAAAAIRLYGEIREDPGEFWKSVSGKEALRAAAQDLGFNNPEALESRAFRMWRDGEVARSAEALALHAHVDGLALVG